MPYLIKDLHFLETGEPARLGSSLFKDYVADHDSAYVARCKKAGLVIFGRTSTPEFGLNPNTEPRLNGSVPQSVEPRTLGRRLIGRCRGGGHCRCSARGARHRRRRLDPHSGGAVRPVRTEAVARTRVVRARLGRGLGRAVGGSRREPQRARFGLDARLHGRYRAWRSLCGANARAIVRGGARRVLRASSGSR